MAGTSIQLLIDGVSTNTTVTDSSGTFTLPVKYGKTGVISVKLNIDGDNKFSQSTTNPFAILVR